MPNYLEVRMLTNLDWVALGHKPDNGQRGMVCKKNLLKIWKYQERFYEHLQN